MAKSRIARDKIIKFLRDPAWGGVRGIFYVGGLVGGLIVGIWGYIAGWLSLLRISYSVVLETELWIILVILGIAVFLGQRSIRMLIQRPRSEAAGKYHDVWGVLWRWPPDYYGNVPGPYCPEHLLPMEILYPDHHNEYFYEFECQGDEGEESHNIRGPHENSLTAQSVTLDATTRIGAKLRKQKLIE